MLHSVLIPDRWHCEIDPLYESCFHDCRLRSLSGLYRHFCGLADTRDLSVVVCRGTLSSPEGQPLPVYFKQYQPARADWRYLGRRSKAAREYDNYAILRGLGIRTPDRLAWGEQRDAFGRLRRAIILTRAVPDALVLEEFLRTHCPDRRTHEHRALRNNLLRQLATMTRSIHAANFCHRDLFWRNVLVTMPRPGHPQVWWIDCPRGGYVRLPLCRRRAKVRDLASLDRLAIRWCTRSERLAFLRDYLGPERAPGAAAVTVAHVAGYSRQRWAGN